MSTLKYIRAFVHRQFCVNRVARSIVLLVEQLPLHTEARLQNDRILILTDREVFEEIVAMVPVFAFVPALLYMILTSSGRKSQY